MQPGLVCSRGAHHHLLYYLLFSFFSDKPENTQFLADVTSLSSVPFGSTITFTCTSDSHPAVREYRFYRYEQRLGKNTTGTFQITARDSGLYSCIPYNDAGRGEKAEISIVVNGECDIFSCVYFSGGQAFKCLIERDLLPPCPSCTQRISWRKAKASLPGDT